MTSAKQYREFAAECLRRATKVESEQDRNSFLDMARDWTLAAMRLEGALIPDDDSAALGKIAEERQAQLTTRK